MKLLLAEDEAMMAEAIMAYLSFHQYEADWAENGSDALDMALTENYDVLILDVMMPEMDGVTALKKMRAQGVAAPALFLTAKSEISDKSLGFQAGGDDYLTKPFAMEELLMRVQALSRRSRAIQTEEYIFADLRLDRKSYVLACGEKKAELSNREYQLMEFLMKNPRMYFTADTLLDRVWGLGADVEQGTVWVHISFLRKKLEAFESRAKIVSKRGIGYALGEHE